MLSGMTTYLEYVSTYHLQAGNVLPNEQAVDFRKSNSSRRLFICHVFLCVIGPPLPNARRGDASVRLRRFQGFPMSFYALVQN